LTLQVLPRAVRPQVSLAYLLARTTDTIADCDLVPLAMRLQALVALRDRITGTSSAPLELTGQLTTMGGITSESERMLLLRCEETLQLLAGQAAPDLQRIREVLQTIIGGQELDLQRFGAARFPEVAALENDAELDDYTYRVAGCVGEFWTHICRDHLFPTAKVIDQTLLRDGIRFGKGLQLVNILRDIPADLRNGRCYIPRQSLAAAGFKPEDLCHSANESRFRPLYNSLLDRAESHLRAGWDYTNALPTGQRRLRLACAWPILIGARTLRRLRQYNMLDSTCRIKITRGEIYGIMVRTLLCTVASGAWKSQFSRELGRQRGSAS
jgi:farnesyl-diphosphate farnesyltransferase